MTKPRQDTPTTKSPHFATLLVMALDPREIGERIRQRREELGWTHQRLADEMDVELRTAQRWQEGADAKGKSLLPRLGTLMELAEKMGVERSYFVERLDPVSETTAQGVLLQAVSDGVLSLERSQENVLSSLDEILEHLKRLEDSLLPPATGERPPS
jgi:transcriptional regulator with XRE-family HTH domain